MSSSSSPSSALLQALQKARTTYASNNPNSYRAHEEAVRSLPGGGTRSSIFIHPFPLFIKSGKGARIEDLDGHEYVDFVSDFTSGIYGKTDPVLKKAIIEKLDNGLQLGAHTSAEARLASGLCARFPSMDLVRFTNSGTEANILAISIALHYAKRSKVVVFKGGYHGSVLSHFGDDPHSGSGPGPGDLKVPYDFLVCPYNDIPTTRALITQSKGEVGAIIVEPMLGAGGCIPGDPGFLQTLRAIADEIGALLIFDEVQTARLGPGGRQQILGITPDLTTLGKFFGGGFAFGAFGGKREIMSMFDARSPTSISHGGTFNNSPLTMVAGYTALEHLLTAEKLERLNAVGDGMRERLNASFEQEGLSFKITGLGSINQIHPLRPASTGSSSPPVDLAPTLTSTATSASTEKETKGDMNLAHLLDLLFFNLLQRGFWIAQRGLISLNFAMSEEDVRGFESAMIESARTIRGLF